MRDKRRICPMMLLLLVKCIVAFLSYIFNANSRKHDQYLCTKKLYNSKCEKSLFLHMISSYLHRMCECCCTNCIALIMIMILKTYIAIRVQIFKEKKNTTINSFFHVCHKIPYNLSNLLFSIILIQIAICQLTQWMI